MSDKFHLLAEPLLQFGSAQDADDPHDGLALFGPAETTSGLPDHVAIGTAEGLKLWAKWGEELNSAAACDDPARHRPWPPFPGYDVAFGCKWPNPIKEYNIDVETLAAAARKADRFERVFSVSSFYLEPIEKLVPRLDAKPALAVCIVPDNIHAANRQRIVELGRSFVRHRITRLNVGGNRHYLHDALSVLATVNSSVTTSWDVSLPPALDSAGWSFPMICWAACVDHYTGTLTSLPIARESTSAQLP